MKAAFDGGDVRSPRHPERHLERVLVRLRTTVDEEYAVVRAACEVQQARRRPLAHRHRYGVALEVARGGLRLQRAGPPRVPVAERGDRVAAVEIEYTPPAAGVQPHARGVLHFERVLREDRRERAHVQPAAGAVRPAVSGRSKRRFIHCTAPPAAPLFRLSTTQVTATLRPFAAAESRA